MTPLTGTGTRTYAHMCRMDHIEIGHNDSGDDERCPVCRVMDALAAERARREAAEGALVEAIQAIRNMRDYAAPKVDFPDIPGWSNHDALVRAESHFQQYGEGSNNDG